MYSTSLKFLALLLLIACISGLAAESCPLDQLDPEFPRLYIPPPDPHAAARAKIQRYLEHAQELRRLIPKHENTGWLEHLLEVIDIHQEAATDIADSVFGKTPLLVGDPPRLRLFSVREWEALYQYIKPDPDRWW